MNCAVRPVPTTRSKTSSSVSRATRLRVNWSRCWMHEPVSTAPALSKPPGAGWLLLPKWQMARHRMARRERGDLRRTMVVMFLGGAFWLASFLIAYRLVKYFRSAEDIGNLLAGKMLAMILL